MCEVDQVAVTRALANVDDGLVRVRQRQFTDDRDINAVLDHCAEQCELARALLAGL